MKTKPTKAILAAISTIVASLTAAFADELFTWDEGNNLILVAVEAALGIWAVWRVPNERVGS